MTEEKTQIKKKALTPEQKLKPFLADMKKAGYTRVAIRCSTPKIPDSVTFIFGPQSSVFGWPYVNDGHWPAIWEVVKKNGIGCGCGNSHQYQINDNLPIGYWELVKGKWVSKPHK